MLKKLSKLFKNPFAFYIVLAECGLTNFVSDQTHLSLLYRSSIGDWPDLRDPKTFNEKLQWLKIHDHDPLYTLLVDKYRVKEWVASHIGDEYVTKTYAVWEKAEDVDISCLPERFVLKTNHDSGGVAICRDRNSFDLNVAKQKLEKHLRTNYYWRTREWPYKDVRPLVFAEEYVEAADEVKGLIDYKLMCFGGKAKCVFTCTGRAEGDLRVDFFDMNWKHLPFTRHYPNADILPTKPHRYEEMVSCAEKLAYGIPFVRVDFYESGNRLLFGEMTFFPGAGFEEFDPVEWDERLGSWIELPDISSSL